jgi:antitoxin component YwqK of YwqJK toxin-antitoxin module
LWTFYDENEIKERETEHKSGKEDGIYSLWYDNGQKKEEGPYRGKTRIELWTWWDEKGNKWQEGSYLDGKRDGTWITWNANGKRRNETLYKNGGFISKKVY